MIIGYMLIRTSFFAGAAIAGIIVAAVVVTALFIILVILIVIFCLKQKQKGESILCTCCSTFIPSKYNYFE